MSIRTFVFCDICNPMGIRCPEQRRESRRADHRGRRLTDARAWVEGNTADAIGQGWILTRDEQHLCPRCQEMHLQPPVEKVSDDHPHGARGFVFCDCCNPQGIRYIELRRGGCRSGKSLPGDGRRVTDGRAWIEGDDDSARARGWFVTSVNHYCRKCAERHPEFITEVA